MIAIRIRSLLILMVCCVGSVWAQNSLTLDPNSDAWRSRKLEQSVCPDHPNPPAVDVAVDSCIDRLVKADVEELPGARLNPAALPANDSELFATVESKQSPTRARFTSATSWAPKPTSSLLERSPPAAEAPIPETVKLPIMPSPADTAATEPTESIDLRSDSALQIKLSHIRLQAPQERARRRSLELQKTFHQQCQTLLLSDAECRLRLQGQKVSGLRPRTDQSASSSRREAIP